MYKILLVLVLISLPSLGANKFPVKTPKLLASVREIRIDDARNRLIGSCSCFKVKNTRVFLTAEHCMLGPNIKLVTAASLASPIYTREDGIKVKGFSPGGGDGTVALVKADREARDTGFELADKEPGIGEEVWAVGFARNGLRSVTVTKGTVAGWIKDPEGYDALKLDINLGPGMSGGPILNKDGKVVGMVQGGLGPPFISYSSRLDEIKTLVKSQMAEEKAELEAAKKAKLEAEKKAKVAKEKAAKAKKP